MRPLGASIHAPTNTRSWRPLRPAMWIGAHTRFIKGVPPLYRLLELVGYWDRRRLTNRRLEVNTIWTSDTHGLALFPSSAIGRSHNMSLSLRMPRDWLHRPPLHEQTSFPCICRTVSSCFSSSKQCTTSRKIACLVFSNSTGPSIIPSSLSYVVTTRCPNNIWEPVSQLG